MDKNAKIVMSHPASGTIPIVCSKKKDSTVLSNPIKTKAIAPAKIKTDKIDAKILADLLRADMIPSCYIPSKKTMEFRELVRHREFLVRQRTNLKNKVHGILLLNGIRVSGIPSHRNTKMI